MTLTKMEGESGISDSCVKDITVNIPLKNHDISLALEIPHFLSDDTKMSGLHENSMEQLETYSSVIQAHTNFKTAMLTGATSPSAVHDRARAEVKIIDTLFPSYLTESMRIFSAAWVAFACEVDDIIETLPPQEGMAVLCDCIEIMQGRQPPIYQGDSRDTRVQHATRALYSHCRHFLSEMTSFALFQATCRVFGGHIEEIRFLDGRIPNNLSNYLNIRRQTMGLNPLFEVIKSGFLPAKWRWYHAWEKLQEEVSLTAGLQNDLVGLERDLESGELMNAVVVLMKGEGWSGDGPPDSKMFSRCVARVIDEHNRSAARVRVHVAQIYQSGDGALPKVVRDVVGHIAKFCETHLKWCASSKRYMVKTE